MKKVLFTLTVLSLLSFGCNRSRDAETKPINGAQQEESRSQDNQNMYKKNEAMPGTSSADDTQPDQTDEAQMEQDRSGQTPRLENDLNQNSDNFTRPIDERPDLEEERPDLKDEMEN